MIYLKYEGHSSNVAALTRSKSTLVDVFIDRLRSPAFVFISGDSRLSSATGNVNPQRKHGRDYDGNFYNRNLHRANQRSHGAEFL